MRNFTGEFDAPQKVLWRDDFLDEFAAVATNSVGVGHSLKTRFQPLDPRVIERTAFPADKCTFRFGKVLVIPRQLDGTGIALGHPASHVVIQFDF